MYLEHFSRSCVVTEERESDLAILHNSFLFFLLKVDSLNSLREEKEWVVDT